MRFFRLFRRRPRAVFADTIKVAGCPVCSTCGGVRIRFEGVDFGNHRPAGTTVWLPATLVAELSDELMARSIAHQVRREAKR